MAERCGAFTARCQEQPRRSIEAMRYKHPTDGWHPAAMCRKLVSAMLAVSVVLSSCGGDVREISDSRVVERVFDKGLTRVSSADRFGMRPREKPRAEADEPAPHFRGEVPKSWREQPPSQLRDLDYLIGTATAAGERLTCWLTVLRGEGGGLLMNVNRWRSQFGLEPIQSDALSKLPTLRIDSLGTEATSVDLSGRYSPRGADGPKDGYRMFCLVIGYKGHTLFLRMTGPSAKVEAERSNFERLAKTLKPLPPGSQGAGSGQEKAPILWATPEGWTEKPARAPGMGGLGDFTIDAQTRCTISALGGGMAPNLNRWRAQMGHEPLTAAAIEELPNIEVLGKPSKLVELRGRYQGMSGENIAKAMLIGVIVPVGRLAVFVKLTGPEDTVREHRTRFLALCKSLRWAQ